MFCCLPAMAPPKPQLSANSVAATNGVGSNEGDDASSSAPRVPRDACPGLAAAPVLSPMSRCAAELCCFCFQVLRAHLERLPLPCFPPSADPSFKAPLFVTWLKKRQRSHEGDDLELRGCIGCLEPITFHSGLSEYAIRSSMKDHRFPPVKLDEVPSLTCRLSILHEFEPCSHAFDWQVGVHGILLNFSDLRGRKYSATYLPEVAREHGMTREVAIRELVAKSGYTGPCDKAILDRMEVVRYQTHVESVAYHDFTSLCPS